MMVGNRNPNRNRNRMAQERLRLRLGLRLKRKRRLEAAFTLIELTISAAVASIILVASYLCLSAGVASQKLIEPRTVALQSARVALAMMSADLRSACSLCTKYDFVGTAERLDFATHHYMPARLGEGDFCQVSYYLKKGRGSEHLSLWRDRNPHYFADPLNLNAPRNQQEMVAEEIVPGVRGLTLAYFDVLGNPYENWGDAVIRKRVKYTTEQATNLTGFPAAVRITLQLDLDPGKVEEKAQPPLTFETVVGLEAPLPIGAAGASDTAMPSNGDDGSQPGQNPEGGN